VEQSYLAPACFAFPHLLSPHRVVEALLLEQFFVAAGFDGLSALEHVDAVGRDALERRMLIPQQRTIFDD
jgi:hypothetical protein